MNVTPSRANQSIIMLINLSKRKLHEKYWSIKKHTRNAREKTADTADWLFKSLYFLKIIITGY